MNLDTKTKVLFKFGSIKTVCEDRRLKKLLYKVITLFIHVLE